MKKITVILSLFLLSLSASALPVGRDTLVFRIYFPAGVSFAVDSQPEDFNRMVDSLSRLINVSVSVSAWSSPEGSSVRNRQLSHERAAYVLTLLDGKLSVPDSSVHSDGVDWEGYLNLLEEDGFDGSEDLSRIIRDTPEWVSGYDGKVVDGRVARLKRLDGGLPWRKSCELIFPKLRRADIVFVCPDGRNDDSNKTVPEAVFPELTVNTDIDTVASGTPMTSNLDLPAEPSDEHSDATDIPFIEDLSIDDTAIKPVRNPGFLLYTNLLYDAALLPNLGTQFHLGKGWATDVRWGYQWLANDEKHFFYRIYGGELAVRKYFGNAPYEKKVFTGLTGHHLGVYGQVFTYDFEFGNKGQIGGTPKLNLFNNPQYGFGLEYGYTIPLGASFNLDLSIGVGYVGGVYHEYEPFYDKYMWLSTYQRHWFGPTRADVTLQWLIGGARRRTEK